MVEPLCECGCGETIEAKPHHKYRGTPRFRPGHQTRTAAVRAALTEATKVTDMDPPNPSGLCMCGCGGKAPISKVSSRNRGRLAGHPIRFIAGHQSRVMPKGKDSPRWKGGKYIRRGYVMLHAPDHPRADSKGYVPEHQVVAENARGGKLLERGEVVHHINGAKDDNRAENLAIIPRNEHMGHHRGRRDYSPEVLAKFSAAGRKGAAKRWGKT